MILELAKAIHISAVIPAEQSVLSVLYEGLKHISLGVTSKKKQYICWHCPNWGGPPSLLPYFWQIYFWQSIDHFDLPPSTRIFDKYHEILGFETYIFYYPFYFLRVRGTYRKTQSPLKWIFFYWNNFIQLPILKCRFYRLTVSLH